MENRYYGKGDIIESATGYLVKVGEPVFDAKVTADEYGVASILVGDNYAIKDDTQYLVTLEVNGTVKMYRELWMSGNTETANEVALSDYTFTMDEGAIGGLTEDDVVIARFEPVEVYTTDAFRAAVGKVAPKSGGGSGGGVLLVKANMDGEGNFTSLDKTWKEIHDAEWGVIYYEQGFLADYDGYQYEPIQLCAYSESDSKYYVGSQNAGLYVAESASDYPVLSE